MLLHRLFSLLSGAENSGGLSPEVARDIKEIVDRATGGPGRRGQDRIVAEMARVREAKVGRPRRFGF